MGPMKPYIIWFLAASLTSPPTPPPSHVVLQPPWPPWTWRGLLWSWNFHSNCSSACNWAHTSSRLAPSSHSDLYFLRNVLECEIHVSAMRMLLDVRPQGAQWSQLAHFGIHCCMLQSQASPARAPPSQWLSLPDTWRQTHSWAAPDSPDNHLWDTDSPRALPNLRQHSQSVTQSATLLPSLLHSGLPLH